MPSIADLLEETISPIKLSILVFGPQVNKLSAHERTRNLQNKRIEIRAELENLGHKVKYAEELVDPSLVGPTANPVVQELVIMQEYDFIVTLVESPGSIVEATLIASKHLLAKKTSLYIDKNYMEGLAGQACLMAKDMGGHLHEFNYPEDLTDCHLLTHIRTRAEVIQLWKFMG